MNDDQVKQVIREGFEEFFGEDVTSHQEDHILWREWRERQIRKELRYEKWKTTAIGTIVATVVGGLVTGLYWLGKLVVDNVHWGNGG